MRTSRATRLDAPIPPVPPSEAAAAPSPRDGTVLPRQRFFAGKGGVGKTTCAAIAALAAARAGERVLLVSMDPAHSLADALGVTLGPAARPVPGVARLWAAELDADRALARWLRDRRRTLGTIAERGTYLDEEDVERFLHLSFPGVDELVGFLELERLARRGAWDAVVVDTAPTGHTLRLLETPETLRRIASVLDDMQGKHRYLHESLGGGHRRDAADRLIAEIDGDGRMLHERLRTPDRCGFTWVMLPERLALAEATDGVRVLDASGVPIDEIVVNRVTPLPAERCRRCAEKVRDERAVIRAARRAFAGRGLRVLPLADGEPRGPAALRALGRHGRPLARVRLVSPPARAFDRRPRRRLGTDGVPAWLDTIVAPTVRLVLLGGKGGVGKTTCAVGMALALARRHVARRVLLLSTDPAHSLGDVLGAALDDHERSLPGAPGTLRVRELDADRAFRLRRDRYRKAVDEVFAGLLRGSALDVTFDRAVVRDLIDLAPPGLDELFGLLGVMEALFREDDPYDIVVVDMAPTGHALRLLRLPATALEWVRALLAVVLKYRALIGLGDFAADLVRVSRDLKAFQALLTDRDRARFVPVTRAAELPRLETVRLLRALRRLHVPISAVVVNALRRPGCARCRRAARAERRELALLRRDARGLRVVATPEVTPPPSGVDDLARWTAGWTPIRCSA